MKNLTIDSKLLFAQNAITNAVGSDEIKSAIAAYGYDDTRLQEGEALYSKASELQVIQVKEYGDQFSATDALNLAKAVANKTYIQHLKIARIALIGDRGAGASLHLTGKRKETFSGWLKEAKTFYTNALGSADVTTAMGRFGITREKLEAGQQLVNEVEEKMNSQLKEKGEAQNATQVRDEAFEELQDWMGDFIVISRIALDGKSQYLEVLGIIEPS
jgi:hypothetical protein